MKLAYSFWNKYLLLLAGLILFLAGPLMIFTSLFLLTDFYTIGVLMVIGFVFSSIGTLCLLLNYMSGRAATPKHHGSKIVSEWHIFGSTIVLLAGSSLLWYLTQSTQLVVSLSISLIIEAIIMIIGVKIITADHWFKACKLGFYMTTLVYMVPLGIWILAYFTTIQKLLKPTQAGIIVLICAYFYWSVIGLLYYLVFRQYYPAVSARKAAIGIVISVCVAILSLALNPMKFDDQKLYQNLKKQLQVQAKIEKS